MMYACAGLDGCDERHSQPGAICSVPNHPIERQETHKNTLKMGKVNQKHLMLRESMNPYFIGGVFLAILSFIIVLVWFCYRAGRNAAHVRSEQQNVTEANIQNAALARMNRASCTSPQTDDELLGKLRDGKEGQ